MKNAIMIAVLTLISQISLKAQEVISYQSVQEAEWDNSEVTNLLGNYILIIIAVAGLWLGRILLGYIYKAFFLSNPV